MTRPANKPAQARTRRALLDLLKSGGPQDSKCLSEALGVSAMAVRQHLYALRKERLVDYEEQARPVGRPAKMWRLTRDADRFFPNRHADLVVSLIQSMNRTFGSEGMEELLRTRAGRQTKDYRKRLPKGASLRKRAEALAKIRSEEGYMAEVVPGPDGSVLLIENHCPICEAATECQGLCGMELEVFRSALGPSVAVERTEHIQAGARRCAYSITPKRQRRASSN